MAWRLAKSLEVLRNEANRTAPSRSKASDGTIGDPAHSRRTSDHNPDAYGVVTALDLTHDPSAGADMHVWAEVVRQGRHPALKYIIWNRRITSRAIDDLRQWRSYNGSNPHTSHMHISVGEPNVYDRTDPWGLEDDMPSIEEVEGAAYRATVKALRQATGPDDASVPAGKWFNEVRARIRDIDVQTEAGTTVTQEQLNEAVLTALRELLKESSSG